MPIRLLTESDFVAVRALALASTRFDAAAVEAILPDSTLRLPSVGGRAEAIVIQFLGTDWPAFTGRPGAPPIPLVYAQGDAVTARQLCQDALVNFCCARVVATGLLQQVLWTEARTADQLERFAIDWQGLQATYTCEGQAALQLLRRAIPTPGRRFASPSGGASGRRRATLHLNDPASPHRHGWGRWGPSCTDDDDPFF